MNIKKILLLSATLVLTSSAFAKDKAMPMTMTKEERTKMADAHSKMADCLRSDKEMSECHKEMMDSCKEMGDKCPMMMMGKDKGMKRHKGKMMNESANSPDDAGKKQHP